MSSGPVVAFGGAGPLLEGFRQRGLVSATTLETTRRAATGLRDAAEVAVSG